MTLPEQNARVEQPLLLISQSHYHYPVRDWEVDPIQAEMQADYTERRLADPFFMEAGSLQPLRDAGHVNTLLDSLEDSLFHHTDEHRLVTTGDWALAAPLQQQTSFDLTGLADDAPAGLALNRLAESGGFYGLAEPGPQDLGRDLLIPTPNHPMPGDEPITVNGRASIWVPGDAITVGQGDDLPEGTRPGFELRTEDDQIRYFYYRRITVEARCPTRVETVTLTPDAPGCARFEGDNGVVLGDDCGGIAHLGFAAVDETGLALQTLGEDEKACTASGARLRKSASCVAGTRKAAP